MKKSTKILLIISIVILVIGIGIATFSYFYTSSNTLKNNNNAQEDNSFLEEPSKTEDLDADYIDFSIFTQVGDEIKLSDYENQAVMILFWNSENEDSIEMLKRVNEIYPNYKEKVNVLAINTKNEKDLEVLNEIEIPMYYDENEEAIKQYNITELPAMIYINSQNEVFNSKTGLTTKDALEANFDILAENF